MLKNVWAGLGFQTGGRVVFGVDETRGIIFALGDPLERTRFAYFVQSGASIGASLGGSGSFVGVLTWGYSNIADLNEGSMDLDLTFAIGLKAAGGGSVGKALSSLADRCGKHYKLLGSAQQAAEKYSGAKYFAEAAWKNREHLGHAFNSSKPGFLVLPVPGAGYGLEVSFASRASESRATTQGVVNLTDAAERSSLI